MLVLFTADEVQTRRPSVSYARSLGSTFRLLDKTRAYLSSNKMERKKTAGGAVFFFANALRKNLTWVRAVAGRAVFRHCSGDSTG